MIEKYPVFRISTEFWPVLSIFSCTIDSEMNPSKPSLLEGLKASIIS